MSFSSGTYSLPGPALNTGDTVSATENNTFRNDVATAFNLTWLRNGTAAATANIPMGGFKFTGLGNGTANGDSIAYGQTADAVIYGLTVGRGAGSVATNTAVGASALGGGSQSGTYNAAVGYQALTANTSGSTNNAFGYSLIANTSGGGNAGFGHGSLASNTTGSKNSAFGGNEGTGGLGPLYYNTTGSFNVGMGAGALANNTTASNNTAVGYQAGYTNATGTYSTFLGTKAGYSATDRYNTFIGGNAGYLCTGASNTFVGAINSAGSGCGETITTGSKNTIIGGFNGNQGGLDIRTASNNIVLSDGDGNPWGYFNGNATSNADFYINSKSGAYYSILNFSIAGVLKTQLYYETTSSKLIVQNNSAGVYLAQNGTSWTSNSDERLKNITGEIQNGLTKVCSLRAAEYTWKSDEEAKPQVGLIAQDVLAVLPQAVNVPLEGATEKDGSPSMMGVQYTEVIPLLVAAIKELKAEFDAYKEAHP